MTDQIATAMPADDRDAFLGTGGTGVLSLSTTDDSPPHAVPVSYGYDATESTFYLRLAVGPDSEKGDLAARPATLVIDDVGEDAVRSVVARGHLESVEESAIGTDALEGLGRVHIPLYDVFELPTEEMPFEFYRLDPVELTSRTAETQ